ncbi:MAG: aldehyde dehydrogenase family protein [Chloroflexota bacterium]
MSFLDQLSSAERAVLESYMRPVQFLRGERILHQGDPGDGCYLIDQGEVRLELEDFETDSDSVLGYVSAGEFLGEFSLLDGAPRSADAFAHSDVQARWLASAEFDRLCEHEPCLALVFSKALGRNMSEKLRFYTGKISEFLFADDVDAATNAMVQRAAEAQAAFQDWPEPRVDALLRALAETVAGQAEALAQACVAETKMGCAPDKVIKIRRAALDVLSTLEGRTACGTLDVDVERAITEIAAPMGVVFGLAPLTNPVATVIFKTLVCLKSRNALIYSCHHGALGVGGRTGALIQGVLAQHGAPVNLVQWVAERTSRRKSMMLMKHRGIAFILATGGPSLVRAAYSSGTPAIGVGAGNAPVLVCADADPQAAAEMVIAGKSFDNGMICASENNLVVEAAALPGLLEALPAHGAAVLSGEEKARFLTCVLDAGGHLQRAMIGQSAQWIAGQAGVERPYPIRLIVVPGGLDELDGPLGREKMAPLVSLFTVSGAEQGLVVCRRILDNEGRGHTAVIHTHDPALIERYGQLMPASRILANVSATVGAIGGGTGLAPTMTLGCGTFGGNSTTDNVTFRHLYNVKRLAQPLSGPPVS